MVYPRPNTVSVMAIMVAALSGESLMRIPSIACHMAAMHAPYRALSKKNNFFGTFIFQFLSFIFPKGAIKYNIMYYNAYQVIGLKFKLLHTGDQVS